MLHHRTNLAQTSGFTLVETLLALVLLILLVGIGGFAVSGWLSGSQLDEGVEQFEAAIRMAQADSAIRGRRFRMSFDAQEPGFARVALQWERDPIQAPGVFEPYDGHWAAMLPNALVAVERSELVGDSAFRLSSFEAAGGRDDQLDAIVFYPNGRSDSARLLLRSVDDSDTRRAVIEIDGTLRSIHVRVLLPDEVEDELAQWDR